MRVNCQEYDAARCRRLAAALRAAMAVMAEVAADAADHSESYSLTTHRHELVDLAYDLNEEIEGFDEAESERSKQSAED